MKKKKEKTTIIYIKEIKRVGITETHFDVVGDIPTDAMVGKVLEFVIKRFVKPENIFEVLRRLHL
jgi:hypothetical protein